MVNIALVGKLRAIIASRHASVNRTDDAQPPRCLHYEHLMLAKVTRCLSCATGYSGVTPRTEGAPGRDPGFFAKVLHTRA